MSLSTGRLHPTNVIALVALAIFAAACAPLPADNVRPATTAGAPTVVVLRSSDNPIYDTPIRGFTESVPGQVSLYTVKSGQESALARAVKADKPALLFTLGSQATVFARSAFPDLPNVFAMVLDPDRLKVLGQPQVAGVALENSVVNTFAQFRLVLPGMRKVLAFHSPSSQAFATRAKEQLAKLDIELVAMSVAGPDEVKTSFPKSLAGYDAIWQINDPVIFTESEFYFLRDKSHETRVPFLASLAEEFAQAGATAAVSVDLTSLGAQTANIVNAILGGKSPAEIGLQPPIGAYLALNLDVARKISLDIPVANLGSINKIISSDADKLRAAEASEEVEAGPGETTVATATQTKPDKPDDHGTSTTNPKQTGKTGTTGTKPDGTVTKPDGTTTKPADPPRVRKPREGRTVVFYDPDANHEAILQITNWFSEFLRSVDPQLKLQPVRSIGTFEKLARNGQADFAILPSAYVQRRGKAGNLVPLLVPSYKGDVRYRKVLFAAAGSEKMATVAATSAGGGAADVVRTLTASGVKMEGVTVIPVSKDVDALLALVFGQVDAALVMPESLEVIKTIQPGAENAIRKLSETKPIVRPPMCAISDVATPELQTKLVAAMKRMNTDAAGARAMRTLGLDAWVAYDPSMLR